MLAENKGQPRLKGIHSYYKKMFVRFLIQVNNKIKFITNIINLYLSTLIIKGCLTTNPSIHLIKGWLTVLQCITLANMFLRYFSIVFRFCFCLTYVILQDEILTCWIIIFNVQELIKQQKNKYFFLSVVQWSRPETINHDKPWVNNHAGYYQTHSCDSGIFWCHSLRFLLDFC